MNKPKTCVVIFNPASTRASKTKLKINTLEQFLPDTKFVRIETPIDANRDFEEVLVANARHLGADSWLCIAAGDGTSSHVVQTLIYSKKLSSEQKSTPILPLWGGNANDLAHMLNGNYSQASLEKIITSSNIVPIHPMQCRMTLRKQVTERIAICYAGFGATAFAAMGLNKPAHRQSKLHALPGGHLAQSLLTVIGALVDAPKFAVKDADDVHVVYERTFANGSRMAKLKYLPVELTDEMFYLHTLEHKKITSAIPKLANAINRKVSSKFLRNYAYFTTHQDVWAHFDGEPLEIKKGTKVEIQLCPQSFNAVSILLGKNKRRRHKTSYSKDARP